MKTETAIMVAGGLVVLFLLWRRMHTAPAVAATPATGLSNPLSALPGVIGSVGGTANAALESANKGLSTGIAVAGKGIGTAVNIGFKTAALPVTLGISAAKAIGKGAYSVGKTVVHDLNPLNW